MSYYDQVLAFAAKHVAPYTTEVDREGRFPTEAYAALKKEGYMGLLVPSEFGGHTKAMYEHAQTCMALAESCATTALCYMMHNVSTMSLVAFSSEEQKKRFLPKIATGEIALTLAFSETGTGTHFYRPEVKATPVEGGYVLNGKKSFITSALYADYYMVLANNPVGEGLDVFIVHKDSKGLRHDAQAWDGLGMRGNSSMPVYFEDVFVTDNEVVGKHGDGLAIVFDVVGPHFILGLASVYSGLGLASARVATEHSTSRSYSDGGRLCEIETVQHHVAKMYMLANASKAFTMAAATAVRDGSASAPADVIAARINASENTLQICSIAMKVGGGSAYAKRLPLERFLRDAYAAAVMAPSTDVLSVWLGKALTDQPIP